MKIRIALFLLVIFGMSACSQYTCPTYAKDDVDHEVKEEQQI